MDETSIDCSKKANNTYTSNFLSYDIKITKINDMFELTMWHQMRTFGNENDSDIKRFKSPRIFIISCLHADEVYIVRDDLNLLISELSGILFYIALLSCREIKNFVYNLALKEYIFILVRQIMLDIHEHFNSLLYYNFSMPAWILVKKDENDRFTFTNINVETILKDVNFTKNNDNINILDILLSGSLNCLNNFLKELDDLGFSRLWLKYDKHNNRIIFKTYDDRLILFLLQKITSIDNRFHVVYDYIHDFLGASLDGGHQLPTWMLVPEENDHSISLSTYNRFIFLGSLSSIPVRSIEFKYFSGNKIEYRLHLCLDTNKEFLFDYFLHKLECAGVSRYLLHKLSFNKYEYYFATHDLNLAAYVLKCIKNVDGYDFNTVVDYIRYKYQELKINAFTPKYWNIFYDCGEDTCNVKISSTNIRPFISNISLKRCISSNFLMKIKFGAGVKPWKTDGSPNETRMLYKIISVGSYCIGEKSFHMDFFEGVATHIILLPESGELVYKTKDIIIVYLVLMRLNIFKEQKFEVFDCIRKYYPYQFQNDNNSAIPYTFYLPCYIGKELKELLEILQCDAKFKVVDSVTGLKFAISDVAELLPIIEILATFNNDVRDTCRQMRAIIYERIQHRIRPLM